MAIKPIFSGRSTSSSVTTLTDIILIYVLSLFLLLALAEVRFADERVTQQLAERTTASS
jgi:hypothetical protein